MALLKLGNGIVDIKGRIGGTIYKRDASGIHAIAPPRHVNYERSCWQAWQRKWYSSKKTAEKYGYPETWPPIDDVPPGTHVIYSLESIRGHRQPSLTPPTETQVVYTGFWMQEITNWIQIYWRPAFASWGLTKNLMFLMMAKWFYISKGTWGFSNAVALAAAKVNMLNWISTTAASTAIPLLGLWAGLVGLGLFFKFLDWLEGQLGHVDFNVGRVIIRKDGVLWFGELIARYTENMYDFAMCRLTPFTSFTQRRIPGTGVYHENIFWLDGLWQTLTSRFPIHYVTGWTRITTRCRGTAFLIGPSRLRMNPSPIQQSYWNVPVGYEAPEWLRCVYVDYFDDYFSYPSHPKPPL